MISLERFKEILGEELDLLPDYVFEELNGGVVVNEKVNLHPDRLADDLYICESGKLCRVSYGGVIPPCGDNLC